MMNLLKMNQVLKAKNFLIGVVLITMANQQNYLLRHYSLLDKQIRSNILFVFTHLGLAIILFSLLNTNYFGLSDRLARIFNNVVYVACLYQVFLLIFFFIGESLNYKLNIDRPLLAISLSVLIWLLIYLFKVRF